MFAYTGRAKGGVRVTGLPGAPLLQVKRLPAASHLLGQTSHMNNRG